MKYLKKFDRHAEYEAYKNSQDYLTPNVSWCVDLDEVHFNKYVRDYSKEYFTTTTIEGGTFTFTMDAKLPISAVPYMSYSVDDGETWVKTDNIDNEAVTVTTPTINAGNSVLWKSEAVQFVNNPDPYPGGNIGYGKFTSTNSFNISGNIMSLMYGEDFVGETALKNLVTTGTLSGSFSNLLNSSGVISAENLILPVTTLDGDCYADMFRDCTSLISAPELPATTLAIRCYAEMFYGCTSLTTAPELPATTLAEKCYLQMFRDCTSLTTAPELPATTLAIQCYETMFWGCTSLTTAPELPATTLVSNCYTGMFYDCTSLTAAPELPATTLANNCYSNMFYGCNNLNYIKAMFTTTPSTSYTNNWVNGVSSTGTFVKNSAASWNESGVNGVPSGWTIETATN